MSDIQPGDLVCAVLGVPTAPNGWVLFDGAPRVSKGNGKLRPGDLGLVLTVVSMHCDNQVELEEVALVVNSRMEMGWLCVERVMRVTG